MKKHSRLTALLLVLLMLAALASCDAGQSAESTDPTGTTAPETTAAVTTEISTEDTADISTDTPPESSDTTEPEQTLPPEAQDALLILKPRELTVLTLFDDEENRALRDARAERLLNEYRVAARINEAENITSALENAAASGIPVCDLLMLDPLLGVKLLIGAELENLDEAGISINSESAGVRRSLTESLVFGGTYLIACDALSSYLPASYALKYNGKSLSSDPVAAALDGSFTVELMLEYIAESTEHCLALGEISPLILYRGIGGHIFAHDEHGLPASALVMHQAFVSRLTRAQSLYSKSLKSEDGIFTLTKLKYEPGAIWLPIPKAETAIDYSVPLDTDGVVLFAAPAGVIDGTRLASLFTAYNLVSSDYRDAARAKLADASVARSAELIALIESSATIDFGPILGWGDIDKVIENGIISGARPSEILTDRVVKLQNEAVQTAAAIIADRLGLEK